MLESGTRGVLSHRWLLRVLISITLLFGEFWICILDLKSKNSQINKLLEMGIWNRIFWKTEYAHIFRFGFQKKSECPSLQITCKRVVQYSFPCTVHKPQFSGVILFITMVQGHLVSLMRWSENDDKNLSTSSKCQYTKVGEDVNNFFYSRRRVNHFQLSSWDKLLDVQVIPNLQ